MPFPLPDIDANSWLDYQRQELDRQVKERVGSFGLDRAIGDKIADLQSLAGEASSGVQEAVGGAATAAQEAVGAALPGVGGAAPTPEAAPAAVAPQPTPMTPGAGDDRMAQIQARLDQLRPAVAPTAPAAPTLETAAPPAQDDRMAQIQARLAELRPSLGQAQPAVQTPETGGDDRLAQISSALERARSAVAERLGPPAGQAPATLEGQPAGGVNPAPTPDEVRSYITQAAAARGIDPDIALTVAQREGGFEAARRGTFKTGSSWWPFQLHYGGKGYEHLGNVAGMGNQFTAETGFEPGDPNAWQAATDYALDRAKKGGWGAWYGAKAAGITGFQGIDRSVPDQPNLFQAAVERGKNAIGGAVSGVTEPIKRGAEAVTGALAGTGRDISQFGDPELSAAEANAACGPAAAVRFAQRFGRNPTLREAVNLAATVGWNAGQGMAGIASQQALMKKMGVDTELVSGPQWDKFAAEAQTGNPITISTSAHYFYADGYDPSTGAFHVGRSGTDLRGGKEWMTKDEIVAAAQRLGGGNVQGALLANNPTVPAESTASPSQTPVQAVRQAVTGAAEAAGRTGETLLEQLQKSSDEAQVRGRAWLEAQQRKLDTAVTDAALTANTALEPVRRAAGPAAEAAAAAAGAVAPVSDYLGRVAGVITPGAVGDRTALASEATRRQLRGEEPTQVGPLQVPGQIGGVAGVVGDTLTEISPYTHGARLYEGAAGPLRRDPVYAAAQNEVFEASRRGDTQGALQAQALMDARAAQINAGRSFDPGSLYRAGLESPDRETAEMIANLAGGAVGTALAPRGLASGGGRAIASLIADPTGAPLSGLTEVLPGLARLAGAAGQTPEAAALAARMPAQIAPEFATGLGGAAAGGLTGWQTSEGLPIEERIARTLGGAGVAGAVGALAPRAIEAAGRVPQIEDAVRAAREAEGRPPPAPPPGSKERLDWLTGQGKWAPPAEPEVSPPSGWDKAATALYFNLLSDPLTHIRNILGSVMSGAATPLETGAAALVDPLARWAVRKGGGEDVGRQRFFGEAAADVFGAASALPLGVRKALRAYAGEVDKADLAKGHLRKDVWADVPVVGGVINAPGRALRGEDAFFSTLNEQAAAYRMAYRQAMQEGVRGNDKVAERVANIVRNPDLDFLKEVKEQGKYRTFQKESGLADSIVAFRESHPLMKLLVPFVRTPINLAKYTLERSPLPIAGFIKDMATQGGRRRIAQEGAGSLSDRMGRATVGSTVMGGLLLWGEDNLTGRAPSDPAERDAFYRQGKQPYSFRSPTDGKWYSYRALQPFSPLFATVANARMAIKEGTEDEKSIAGIGLITAMAIGQSMLDTQWTQGLADALDIMSGQVRGGGDIEKAINDYLERQGTMAAPGAMRALARATDSTLRDPDNPLEAWLANMPGLSYTVAPRLDAFGNPRQRPTRGLEAVLNPFSPSEPSENMLERELARLQLKGGDYKVQPGFVGREMTVLGEDVKLDTPEQRRYQRLSGQIAYGTLQALVGSDEWLAMNDEDKAKAVDKTVTESRKVVREVLAEDPRLQLKAAREMVRSAKRSLKE
jgi:hypothetical protein